MHTVYTNAELKFHFKKCQETVKGIKLGFHHVKTSSWMSHLGKALLVSTLMWTLLMHT